jgi:hypothetical protein
VLQDHIAGSPVAEVLWTDLTATDIAQALTDLGTDASRHLAQQLLAQRGFSRRKAQKSLPMGRNKDRHAQFVNIARLKQEYLDAGSPVLSIDTKRRELIGNFFREGQLYSTQARLTFDHDFPKFAEGVVIPHGLYDLRLNKGYVHLGTSHDTSAFACDCMEDWWWRFGLVQYPQAEELLLLADGGGSNSAGTNLFKMALQQMVNRLKIRVRVAHYPPYCSKYNPIEHRLFPHLSRACKGVVFTSVGLVKRLMEKARTRTGLRVVVDILDKVYQTGLKAPKDVKKTLDLVHDDFLPKWNYCLRPQTEPK